MSSKYSTGHLDFSSEVFNAMLESGSAREAKSLFLQSLKQVLSGRPALATSWVLETLIALKNVDASYLSELVRGVFIALIRRGAISQACELHSALVTELLKKHPGHAYKASLAICTSLVANGVEYEFHLRDRRKLQELALELMDRAIEEIEREVNAGQDRAELFRAKCELGREKAKLLMVLGMTLKQDGRFDECADLSLRVLKELLSCIAKSRKALVIEGVPKRLISIEILETVCRQLSLKNDRYRYGRSQLMSSAKALVNEFPLCLAHISKHCLKNPLSTDELADVVAALRVESRQGDEMALRVMFALADLLRVRAIQWSEVGQYKKAVNDLEWSLRCLADEDLPLGLRGRGLNQRLLGTLAEIAAVQQHLNLPRSVYVGHVVQRESAMLTPGNEAIPAVRKALKVLSRRSKVVFLDSLSDIAAGDSNVSKRSSVELTVRDESGNSISGAHLANLERSKRHEWLIAARVERLKFEVVELDHFGLHITLGKIGDSLANVDGTSSALFALEEVRVLVQTFITSHMPLGIDRFNLIDWQHQDLAMRRVALYEAAALVAERFAPADALEHLDKLANLREAIGHTDEALQLRIRHFRLCKKIKHCLWGAKSAFAISEGYGRLSKTQPSVQFALDGLSLLREGLDYLFLREDLVKYLDPAARIQRQLLSLVFSSKSTESVSYARLFAEVDATQARIFEHSALLADKPDLLALETDLGDTLLDEGERSQTIEDAIKAQLGTANEIHLPALGTSVIGFTHDTAGLLTGLQSVAKSWIDTDRLFVRYFWDGSQMWILPLRFSPGDPPPYICYEPRQLKCEPSDIRKVAEHYDKKASRCLKDDIDLREGLAQLWDWLIAPLADLLKENRLVVVLSDEIRGVPFHSLLNRGRFLIQDRLVSYIPSLSALRAIHPMQAVPSLVVGLDASLEANTEAERVAIALQDAAPGVAVLRPGSADECLDALLSNRSYDFVYISGHGYVSNSQLRSELQVGERLITHRQWMQWGPTARIVFFNICHVAGDPKILPGEHEGFMAASFVRGTQFCLAADREIESSDAIAFGRSFVASIADGADPVLASARAMRSAIGRDAHAVPLRVWTPYFMYGVA